MVMVPPLKVPPADSMSHALPPKSVTAIPARPSDAAAMAGNPE